MKVSFLFRLVALVAALGILTAPVEAKPKPKSKDLDLTDTVLANRILTKFAILLQASDLASFTSSRGPLTLFAPTDSAFSRIPQAAIDALLRPENKETLQRIILFHLVNGKRLTAKDLVALKTLPSCEGTALTLHVNHTGSQIVQKAKILHADMRCVNGLIHEVDRLLLPPNVSLTALAAMAPAPPPPDTNAPSVAPTNAATDTNAIPVAPSAAPDQTNAAIPTAPIAPTVPPVAPVTQ